MSANTVTEELKASLNASMEQHWAFPEQERRVLDRINVLLRMVSTLQSLAQAAGGNTGIGMEMLQFGTDIISTQPEGMRAIIKRMRTNIVSINAEPIKCRLEGLRRARVEEAIPDLYTTKTAIALLTEFNSFNNQLNTMEFGSMAYDQQVNRYMEEVYPGTERRF